MNVKRRGVCVGGGLDGTIPRGGTVAAVTSRNVVT